MLTKTEDIRNHWGTVLDTIQEGLMIMSPGGRILYVNRAAQEMTGYDEAELVGQSCRILECTGCNIYDRGFGREYCELFVVGKVASKRCLVKGKFKNDIYVFKRASIIEDDDGRLIGAVEALTDISEDVRKEKEIFRLRRSLAGEDGFHGLVGRAESMRRVFRLIEDAAASDAAVMITGESGTGKELIARAIHGLSRRKDKPFVKVDCVTLNENLLESELFGHVKGAFTGADRDRVGRFEQAEGGYVFLDEIGDVSPAIQVKLLRVLEEKAIERVGGNQTIRVDARVITATNRNLPAMLPDGLFREDLYYRINVVPIKAPSLRERREDIPLIAKTFAERLAGKTGKDIDGFSPEAMSLIYRYPWPGNVRELRNAVEYAFVVCRDGLIQPQHLPETIYRGNPGAFPEPEADHREELIQALKKAHGNQSEAARILGVSRMTVWKKMKKLGVNIARDVV